MQSSDALPSFGDGDNDINLDDPDLDFDDDTCSPSDIDKLFKRKYKIHDEVAVAYDSNYVLSLAKDDSFTCIAAGLSNGSVRLFEINSEKGIYITPPECKKSYKVSICGTCFLDETSNLLLVGTTNGLVRLLDLRTRSEVIRFQNIVKNGKDAIEILCFDRNANSRLLCMGTVQRKETAKIKCFDIRSACRIFSYVESHQDDITTLRFHPQKRSLLCSGSTDGLINIFYVFATHEERALKTTINTESTVQKVNWHKNSSAEDLISCITHNNEFKSYEICGDVLTDFDRLKITENIERKNESNCYLIDCHNTIDNSLMLIAGSTYNNGEILRSCVLQNGQLCPYAQFDGNKQIVRTSIFDAKTEVLVTAGESGLVTLWTPRAWDAIATSSTSSSN